VEVVLVARQPDVFVHELEGILKLGLPVAGASEAARHGHDHGDGDHGLVVLE
jgi:hypothetical protein